LFALNPRSGSLVTAGRIDREELCAQSVPCLVSFNILVEDKMKLYPVEVEIIDINDNTPQFQLDEVEFKMNEITTPGTRILLPFGQDLDVGMNSLQSYQLSSNPHFSLDVQQGADGSRHPEMVLQNPLDREEEAAHHLLLTASDGGNPVRSGTLRIHVQVVDVNDNPPAFTQAEYHMSVPENVPLGTLLLTVKATDPDEGSNGEVTYSFHNTDHKIAQIFQLDSYTGEISNKESLNFEEYKIYPMEIQAQDGAGLMARAKVLVKVLDINDNAPEVTMTSVTTAVPENFPPGAIIALISVHDQDSGENGDTTCSIPENLPFKLEKLDDSYYHLVTERTLDRELTSIYKITVTATDQGIPSLPVRSGTSRIHVTVMDANDNAPVFTQSEYRISVPENMPVGTRILTVTATDTDEGYNAQVAYFQEKNPGETSEIFELESASGDITIIKRLDYEDAKVHEIDIEAQDGPGLLTRTKVIVTVLDVNDNAPEFYMTSSTSSIPEDSPPGTVIALFNVYDRDSGQNAFITCSLPENLPFKLERSVDNYHRLVTTRALDREQFSFYNITVTAKDGGKPSLSTDAYIMLQVADINDNPPTFPHMSYSAYIPENNPRGASIISVTAFDPDVGMNSLKNYYLSPNNYFSLTVKHVSDGTKYPELVLERALDREQKEVHQLVLIASDGGNPVRSGNLYIQVIVLDANDNPPVFTQSEYQLSVQENLPVGTTLLTVNATDPDEGFNAQVSYILDKMPGKVAEIFYLNSVTGDISILKSLDYEDAVFYEIKIEAQDGPGLLSRAKILVTVLDVNDNAPEVTITSLTGSVLEEATAGREIALINVHDRDSGQNGQVTVFVLGNVPFNLEKSIDQYYRLVTARSLDREQVSEYNITLRATDGGSPPLSTNIHITLHVADINDNPPAFSQASYSAYIPENNPRGASIFCVTAQDPDSIQNAHITYAIYTINPNEHFSVTTKGSPDGSKYPELLLEKPLDREQQSSYQLILTAVDGGDPPLSGTTQIQIRVTDANDNAPLFSQDTYRVSIQENVPWGTSVLQVMATDQDQGVNAEITYAFLNAPTSTSLLFNLNPNTGDITTNGTLDFEEASRYMLSSRHHLVLTAVDGGNPARSCTTQIMVVVADANDNAPVFTQEIYRVSVPENLPVGSSILRVMATDLDEGVNAEITYTFINIGKAVRQLFKLDSTTGELTTSGGLDFEQRESYTIGVEAKDGGRHTAHCKVQIDILDENDNAPEITLDSESKHILEDAKLGTVVALIKTYDLDSGYNGEVFCQLKGKFPFKIVQDIKNTYKLVTDGALDREQTPEYNITITVTDRGRPPLSSNRSITLKIADVNDNAPVFHQASYVVHVAENNPPGASIFQVSASDPDLGSNGHVSYSIVASDLEPRALASYVSVNTQSGVVFAQRAFDHEQLRAFELTVQARDQGSPALSANVSLRVLVGDRNDNAPRVLYPALGPDGSALFDTVPRAAQPGYLVTKVVAVDADSGHNAWLSYHVLQASEPGLFSLGLRTGEVRTAQAIHHLILTAVDGGAPVRSGTARILVTVLDVNDNAPVFTQPVYRMSVPENLPVGTPVLSVNATDQDEGVHAEVMYSFLRVTEKISKIFCLNAFTGEISTSANLDYEDSSFYELDVEARDRPGLLDRAKVLITILDVNDNVPEVVVTSGSRSVAENMPPGTVIALFQVYDRDSGLNGLVTCSISRSMPFELEKSTGDDGAKYPELVLERVLDREEEAVHHLLLTASDGGDPPRSETAHIQVTVVDVNDHAPVFSLPQYQVTVPENVPVGTRLLTVHAVDLDEGVNGEVTYSFRKITQKILQIFQLNSHTGELATLESLDYEESSYYEMEVQAQDGPGSMTRAKVIITILDVNDNAPEVTLTSVSNSVPEDTPPGTVIALFYLQDRDSGKNGEVTCSITENLPFKLERSIDNYYRLVTAKNLDREKLSVYNITLKATDGGTPPLSMETHISVNVADTNDNPPAFPHSSYSVYIPENNPRGASIFSVTAHDPDSHENAQVTYSLAEDTLQGAPLSSYVSINSDTGLVLKMPLDREEQKSYQLTLTALDGGDPPLSSTAQIQVLVTDANDNPPVFSQEVYRVGLPENVLPGTTVLRVMATDQDEGVNAQITFSFTEAGQITQFDLNSNTGEITILNTLDFEEVKEYSIVLEARDGGGMIAQCTVEIEVQDINDNFPEVVIQSLPDLIMEDTKLGTHVALLKIRDKDSGYNGEVTCKLEGDVPFKILSSSINTYKLVTDGVLDREQTPEYNITITATDRGKPPLSSRCSFTLRVGDVNDNAPIFHQASYLVRVMENNPPGASIAQVSASDPDLGPNGHVSYSIVASDLEPRALAKYPELALEKRLDREQQSYYRLVLTALDGGDPPLSGTTELRIQVTDANDNPPVFNQDVYRISLSENVPPGTTVLQVSATDQDEGINSEITYSFYRTGHVFSMNSKSGEITTLRTLDFEEIKEYSIVVEARDGGGLAAQCTVEINIQDENDNSPEVTFHSLAEMILEDAAPGTLIALIKIYDQDSGENGEVNCRLEGEVPFQIISSSKNSYKLVIDGTLDREQTPEYNVTITATDRGKPPLSASTSVTLIISDVNDNAPIFHQASYVVHVMENNPPGASIAQVSASDPDLGPNGHVSYSIVASDLEPRALASYVSVNTQSGVVFAQRAFDHEQLRAFELTVQARDQGSPALSANVSLRVLVGDRNDNAPRVLYPALGPDGSALFDTVPRAAQPGYLVTKVVAVDADSGHNAWLSYHVLQASEPGLFSLGLRTGEVRTARALGDRDAARQRLLVAVRDGGQPPLATTRIEISVRDANDNFPVFSKDEYRISVSENLPPGSSVLQVTATDKDEGVNAEVNYYFRSTAQRTRYMFSLDEKTGMIKNNQSLDFEDIERYTMEVEARDGGGLSTQCKVVIEILDENDNRPEIIITSLSDEILEDSLPGMVVVLFKTRDKDFGANGEVMCNIGKDIPFKIYSSSNNYYKLVTDGPLDREQTPEYNVTITATDRGNPPLSSRTTITLHITDVNDNTPIFHQASYVVHVMENNPPGASIAQVSASDPDLGPNGHVSYSIVASDLEPRALASYVSVNTQSGVLVLERALDWEREPSLQVVLTALDGGTPARSATLPIRITVLDANDNAPAFNQSLYRARVLEDAPPGTVVVQVYATDLDEGPNGEIIYSLGNHNRAGVRDLFSLDLVSGVLTIKGHLDFEDTKLHEIYIQAKDKGANPEGAHCKVLVEVVDVNDNAPEITVTSVYSPVPEDAPLGTVIALLSVIDLDAGENGLVTCEVPPGLPFSLTSSLKNYFTLKTSAALDRETVAEYNLSITARDSGTPSLSALTIVQVQLRVSVLDVNDNAPAFQQSSYRISVLESAPAGMLLIQLNASDPDLGPSGNVTFSFSGHTPDRVRNLFSLHPTTGKLTLQGPLDFESENYYEFDIRARDGGSPAMEQHCSLRVDLLDVNDNAPHITVTSELGTLPESAEPGTVVALISVQDPDSGSNGDVSLRIPDHLPFALKSAFRNQFSLVTAGPLDREAKSSYDIMVTASDAGNPPLSTQRSIFLNISDVNDNPPSFFQRSHEVFVPENNRPGDLLCSLAASDPD
ncbi:FAT4 protein, partial [Crocuta crocuta]